MNPILALVQAARTASDHDVCFYSNHMLAEFRSLHEAMVEQLSLERLGTVGRTEFLSGMIEQHRHAAAAISRQLGAL